MVEKYIHEPKVGPKEGWKIIIGIQLLKKTEIFKTANSQKNFAKVLWIGPWISSIDLCEGH